MRQTNLRMLHQGTVGAEQVMARFRASEEGTPYKDLTTFI